MSRFTGPFVSTYDIEDHPISKEILELTQRELDVRFPGDFAEFLQEHNGVTFHNLSPRTYVPLPPAAQEQLDVDAVSIAGIGHCASDPNDGLTIVYMTRMYEFDRPGLEGLIAFGRNTGDDAYAISCRPSDYGTVYFYRSEHEIAEPGEDHPTNEKLIRLAASFTEFWSLLFLGDSHAV